MAQIIKLRRSSTEGKVPTTSDLNLGELAINTNDGRIFFEKNDGSASIKHVITSDSQTTGSIEITGNISGSATTTGSFGVIRTPHDFVVNTAGRVGINTTTPDYKLDVAGNMGINEYIYHNGDANTYFRFQADQVDLSAGGNVVSYNGSSIDVTGNVVASNYLKAGGNLIVGTSDSSFRFDDSDSTDSTNFTIHQNGASGKDIAINVNGSGNKVVLATASTASLYIDQDQNVVFPVANQKISGSGTSTGSFGRLEVTADTISIGGTEINKTVADNTKALVGDSGKSFTANRVASFDSNGELQSSVITTTELGYLDDVSSALKEAYDGVAFATDTGILTLTELDGGTDTVDLGIGTADSPQFAGVKISGNAVFGNGSDDKHSISGSLHVTGSVHTSQQTIAATTTTAIDFTDSNNFKVTLGTGTTLSSSNESYAVGSTGVIVLVQDGSGGHSVALPGTWKTPKGQAISFDTGANDINIISYYIIDASTVAINYMGDFS